MVFALIKFSILQKPIVGILGKRGFSSSSFSQQSICKAGTPLNLKVKKTGKEPVALEDDQYPEWLWKLLDEDHQRAQLEKDPVKKAKKLLRKQNIEKIKLHNFMTKMG